MNVYLNVYYNIVTKSECSFVVVYNTINITRRRMKPENKNISTHFTSFKNYSLRYCIPKVHMRIIL